MDKKLPEGSVAGVTVKSFQLISSGLKRLNEITEDYSYRIVNFVSCLTLDVDNFYSSKHFKSTVLSNQQYCRQFESTVKDTYITNVNVRDRENRKYKPGEVSFFLQILQTF